MAQRIAASLIAMRYSPISAVGSLETTLGANQHSTSLHPSSTVVSGSGYDGPPAVVRGTRGSERGRPECRQDELSFPTVIFVVSLRGLIQPARQTTAFESLI